MKEENKKPLKASEILRDIAFEENGITAALSGLIHEQNEKESKSEAIKFTKWFLDNVRVIDKEYYLGLLIKPLSEQQNRKHSIEELYEIFIKTT